MGKEAEKEKKKKKSEKSLRYGDEEIEFVRPGGNEAWDMERETQKRKRQNDNEYID